MPTVTQKSVLDRIAIDVDGRGTIQVHWAKLTWIDDRLVERGNHIALLSPGDDIDETFAAVRADLEGQGYPEVDQDTPIEVGLRVTLEQLWTPEVVEAHMKRLAAATPDVVSDDTETAKQE